MNGEHAFAMNAVPTATKLSRSASGVLCRAFAAPHSSPAVARSVRAERARFASIKPQYIAASGAQRSYFFGQRVLAASSPAPALQDLPVLKRILASVAAEASASKKGGREVRVRFAPSPTGNLHVGGARTALFNWLFARNKGGKFILRVEDTDLARSTRESEEMVLRDLKWLGVQWDEGPDVGGPHGPYRQSERNEIYTEYAKKLVEEGKAYPCFCTEEELDAKRKQAEAEKRPPHYDGTCRGLSKEEAQRRIDAGEPHTYRFKVPAGRGKVVIQDIIRGEVSWPADAVGDFILIRSNGMPVYNFCVAVDDALMRISHVIRAEEHLSNTLRQILIYEALGFPVPEFAHVSLILGEDRSKLSKRHGATSLDQFKQEGFLAPAMMNYLALLGWNDGSEQEFYSIEQLVQAFSLDRITKSAAIFDQAKLRWVNGQHVKSLPADQVAKTMAEEWGKAGIVRGADSMDPAASPFLSAAVALFKDSLEKVTDANGALESAVSYPLEATMRGETPGADGRAALLEDAFVEFARTVVAQYEAGALGAEQQLDTAKWKEFVKGLQAETGRKGKKLFMPLRLALTGQLQGPDVGAALKLVKLAEAEGLDVPAAVPLDKRLAALNAWLASQ